MTKIQLKKIVAPQLAILLNANSLVAMNKWARSKAITEMKSMVNWKITPYVSFKNFVNQELPEYKWATIVGWCIHYAHVKRLKYTQKELGTISKSVCYSLAVSVLTSLRIKKISVKAFIAKAQQIKNSTICYRQVGNANAIYLCLSDTRVAKFEALISPYGYKRVNGKRMGVSQAFSKYLDTI